MTYAVKPLQFSTRPAWAVVQIAAGKMIPDQLFIAGKYPTTDAEACRLAYHHRRERNYCKHYCGDYRTFGTIDRRAHLTDYGMQILTQTSRDNGERRTYRFLCHGPLENVQQWAAINLPGRDICADYSPTGQWFGDPAKVRTVRPGFHLVTYQLSLDC